MNSHLAMRYRAKDESVIAYPRGIATLQGVVYAFLYMAGSNRQMATPEAWQGTLLLDEKGQQISNSCVVGDLAWQFQVLQTISLPEWNDLRSQALDAAAALANHVQALSSEYRGIKPASCDNAEIDEYFACVGTGWNKICSDIRGIEEHLATMAPDVVTSENVKLLYRLSTTYLLVGQATYQQTCNLAEALRSAGLPFADTPHWSGVSGVLDESRSAILRVFTNSLTLAVKRAERAFVQKYRVTLEESAS